MNIKDIRDTIKDIEDYVKDGDNEGAHGTEDDLMKEFIIYLSEVNEQDICVVKIKNFAKEISKVFEL